MAKAGLHKTMLEVERKFSRLRVYPLQINGGKPAFRNLVHLGSRTFRDLYFDNHNLLSQNGTWVRQRDGRWEGKIRQGGDYDNSRFKEIQDPDKIQRHVHMITKASQSASSAFGLSKIADITTHRETWKADNAFKIVLDRTDFDHTVGEVELEVTLDLRSDAEAQKCCAQMDLEIQNFMERYAWAFDTSPAIGKLTAYFAHQQSQILLKQSAEI